MVVGRDPNSGAAFSPGDVGAVSPGGSSKRENFVSRWAHGLKHKLDQTFAGPQSADGTPDVPPRVDRVDHPDEDARRPIPAAASGAWYNRVWR
jgi:hypothetical protein